MGCQCDCGKNGTTDMHAYLVQIDSRVFWHRHVDHLRILPYNQIYLPSPSDFIPVLLIQNSLWLSNKVPNNMLLKDNILKD